MLALFLMASLVGSVGAAQGAVGTGRIDLKVLVINGAVGELGTGQVDALVAEMDREGVPYTRVDSATEVNTAFLEDLRGPASHGKYQAVIVPNSNPLGLTAAETVALQRYERSFGVRQLDAFVDPTPPGRNVGLQNLAIGPLDGLVATVSAGARVAGAPFAYLDGPVPIDNVDATVQESFGFLAQVAVTAPQTFTPLVTTSGLVANAPLVGVFGDNGREELVVTGAYNQNQQWFQTLGHGLLTWVTRGVHLGYDRNYFSVHVDDVFLADGRWSPTAHCTPGDDFCPPGTITPDIRMTPADVARLLTWQSTNNFRFDMVFNGGGSDLWKLDQVPPLALTAADPLVDAFTAGTTEANFDWINHTFTHPFMGCIQIPPALAGQVWHCAANSLEQPHQDPTLPGEQSGNTFWLTRAYIESQIQDNINWARTHGLPTNINTTELVSGEHSGLLINPQQPIDNPFFVAALTNKNIAYTASDMSREPNQRLVQGGTTRTVPRHPMNIFYNVGTYTDEVSEYNWIYAPAPGGNCTNTTTTTCMAAPLPVATAADALASFTSTIRPIETRIALSHVLTNDPAPHYAHQSNLAEDGVLYPVIEDVLSAYRARFADNAPIVEPTMTASGLAFARSAAWGPARASTTAYLDRTGVHVSGAPAGVQVPVTVPTLSTGATLGAYAGELSGWNAAPVNISVPDVGYTTPVGPTVANPAAAPATNAFTRSAPTVRLVRVNPLTLSSSVTHRWQTTTNGSAVTGYQVYVRRAAFGKSLPSTWRLLRTVTAPTTKVSLGRGETVSIAVKPVANKATQMSAPSTVSLPLAVSSMVKSRGWKKVARKAFYSSAALQSSRKGATLKLPTVARVSRVALIASTGRGNGKVDILVGGKTVRTVNLSTRTAAAKLIFLPAAFRARSGAVVLKVRTSGKQVRIQGFAVLR